MKILSGFEQNFINFNQIIAHNSFSKQKNLSVAQFLREIFDMLVVILTLALE